MTHTVPRWHHQGRLQRSLAPCKLGSHPARGDELGPALLHLSAVWQQTRRGITPKPLLLLTAPAPGKNPVPRVLASHCKKQNAGVGSDPSVLAACSRAGQSGQGDGLPCRCFRFAPRFLLPLTRLLQDSAVEGFAVCSSSAERRVL